MDEVTLSGYALTSGSKDKPNHLSAHSNRNSEFQREPEEEGHPKQSSSEIRDKTVRVVDIKTRKTLKSLPPSAKNDNKRISKRLKSAGLSGEGRKTIDEKRIYAAGFDVSDLMEQEVGKVEDDRPTNRRATRKQAKN